MEAMKSPPEGRLPQATPFLGAARFL